MKITEKDKKELQTWADNGDCPTWLQEWAMDHYADTIPYGTLTGDTGTIDEFLIDYVEDVLDYFDVQGVQK